MSEYVTITIIVADRAYPLKVERGDEALVHECIKGLNDKLREFESMYAGKDKQDFLAMSAIMNIVDAFKNSSKLQLELSEVNARLKELDTLISK